MGYSGKNYSNYTAVMLNGVKHPFEVQIVRNLSLSSRQTLGQIKVSGILRFTQTCAEFTEVMTVQGKLAICQVNSKPPE
ncbi:hypothetical protein MNBD_CHLOROFLEXI01-5183 [hydrothermal vent metagenome]|uniref:Uncharacterized protein n=1 Tax=hydrothermal vent metagenome TaxID=652676 RepID=A0A3B0V1D3_9ZZZZ